MGIDVIAPADETVQHELDSLEKGLIEEFCPPLNPDEVRRCCAKAIASLESAEIHSYILVLVEHDVRQKLRRVRAARMGAPANGPVDAVDTTSSFGSNQLMSAIAFERSQSTEWP